MRWKNLTFIFAVLGAILLASSAGAEDSCGFFTKVKAECQADHSVKVSWEAALNGNCTDFNFSVERSDNVMASWVTISDPATSPYYDPAPRPWGNAGWYYRIKMTGLNSGNPVVVYSNPRWLNCGN